MDIKVTFKTNSIFGWAWHKKAISKYNQSQKIGIKAYFIILLLALPFFTVKSQSSKNHSDIFPKPPQNKKMLFFLQRTLDRNTLIYEVNLTSEGVINHTNPINIYWIEYEKKGDKLPLTMTQKIFSYGIKHKWMDKDKKLLKLNLVSYKKIDMYLKQINSKGDYGVNVLISNKICRLSSVFVNMKEGNKLKELVTTIELLGYELSSGKKIFESINPN